MFRNYILFLGFLLAVSCSNESQQKATTLTKPNIIVPNFNADSAYSFIEKQVSFGPRVISSKGWQECAIWLEKKLIFFHWNYFQE